MKLAVLSIVIILLILLATACATKIPVPITQTKVQPPAALIATPVQLETLGQYMKH